jgi:hypothetical protein
MHVVPFSDIFAFLQDWWHMAGGQRSSVDLVPNYMGYPRCCPKGACSEEDLQEAELHKADWRIPYCTTSPMLYNLLQIPRLHDHRDGQWEHAYQIHKPESWAEIKLRFHDELSNMVRDVDLFLCGHPIYWCSLLEPFIEPPMHKAMIAVYDQPPFFLVPTDAEESFAQTLRGWALPDLGNVAIVGFAPFFARQFEWLLGSRIPHSRPIALVVRDVWQPLIPDSVLLATSIDHVAIGLILRFAELNPHMLHAPEGHSLRFVRWNEDLGYEASKAVLAQHRCVVLLPYDFAHFKLPEFVAMGMPIFMHAQLWKWTVRWSQLIARPGGRNASWFRPVPQACYGDGEPDTGLALPTLPSSFWATPWTPSRNGSGQGEVCTEELLLAAEESSGPFGWAPLSPFTAERRHLQPLDSAVFWSGWSEMALIPHTRYFESISDLLLQLHVTELEALQEISKLQRLWHRRTAFQVVDFWRGLITALFDRDAGRFKGQPISAAA